MSLTYTINQPSQVGSRSVAIGMIVCIHVAALMAFNNGFGPLLRFDPPPPINLIPTKPEPVVPKPVPLPSIPQASLEDTINIPKPDLPVINFKAEPVVPDIPRTNPPLIQTDTVTPPVIETTRLAIVKRIDPVYPAHAEAAGNEGTVLLEVIVDTSGHASDVHIASSSGFEVLDQAAIRAVKQWKFNHPSTIVKVKVPITFRLTQRF